ncbi:Protein-glucosylgalactosylhydroxylysine glucosidase [Branchiostoma belcheri]|nr:Protein-glucosylgalactosylhydroxylysine glucosidase [Branchiostoma belcheri]
MGGFLQAVLFGYGGFRLHVDHFTVSSDVFTVNVTSLGGDYPLEIRAGDSSYNLQEGLPVQLPRGPATIATTRQDSNRCTPPVVGDGTAARLQGTPWMLLPSLLLSVMQQTTQIQE